MATFTRKPIAIALCAVLLVCGFLLLLFGKRQVTGEGEPFAAMNGDTNGDGECDVSDAVYLLRYLFSAGPPPAACADSPDLVARVAALEARQTATEADVIALQDGAEDIGASVYMTERVYLSCMTTDPARRVEAILPFGGERLDTRDIHDQTSGANSKLVAPEGGTYVALASIRWDEDRPAGDVELILNGSVVVTRSTGSLRSGVLDYWTDTLAAVVQLSRGDFLEVRIGRWCTRTTMPSVVAGEFSIARVAPAE